MAFKKLRNMMKKRQEKEDEKFKKVETKMKPIKDTNEPEVIKEQVVGEEVEEEETSEEDKEETKKPTKTIVVAELPTQPIREVTMEDGTVAKLITTEEALTKLMEEIEEE